MRQHGRYLFKNNLHWYIAIITNGLECQCVGIKSWGRSPEWFDTHVKSMVRTRSLNWFLRCCKPHPYWTQHQRTYNILLVTEYPWFHRWRRLSTPTVSYINKSCDVPLQDFARLQLMHLPSAHSNEKLFTDYTFPPDKTSLTYVYSGDDRYEQMVFTRAKVGTVCINLNRNHWKQKH